MGGWFKAAGSTIVNNIARWDGSNWSALGSGTNGEVTSIAISGTDIFIGGQFTMAGGVAANYVAKWNGTNWSPVGTGPGHPVYDLEMSGSTIYVGGGIWDPPPKPLKDMSRYGMVRVGPRLAPKWIGT